ncbi:Telomere recombination [Carpediemonas membranifera]|uniref:Threonylcarbamoyl-AMP synthase n=1 Tax=Carpediemonas membranifera TaxID=201153 RepID=A0A8J6EAH5_9EUKA|nr:Telomere recombination [Carpediemonas membranifera]|eukprot:KAG9394705.1 Telomere recombination [Carpediemonas membranifera]
MATIKVASTDDWKDDAFERLRAGRLVAFPTETVYGLGAHAKDEAAVRRIFEYKGRPLDDPVIVHVHSVAAARALVDLSDDESVVFEALASSCWPGPLTIVSTAQPDVPLVVRADGPTVGVRVPSNSTARALLEHTNVPIAAPSANTFGHVSPTTADHVFADLGSHDILIIDDGPCDVGVESTVARVHNRAVTVLRRGGTSVEALKAAVETCPWAVEVSVKVGVGPSSLAPGQHLKHYAPGNAPAFVVRSEAEVEIVAESVAVPLGECGVLDIGGNLAGLRGRVRHYHDLTAEGDTTVAARGIYAGLRGLEAHALSAILLPDVSGLASSLHGPDSKSLDDKLFRASQGRYAMIRSGSAITDVQ